MSLIKDAVQQGLSALRDPSLDIQKLGTYHSKGQETYDTTTGAVSITSTAYTSVPMIFTSYDRKEIDGEAILAEDQKVIISTRDLVPVPTINDAITRADGSIWSVISIKTDPAGAAWVLQVRRP